LCLLKTPGSAGGSIELTARYQKKPLFVIRYSWFPDHYIKKTKEACPNAGQE